MENLLLFIHPALGVLAMLAAVRVFVDALNATEGSGSRIKNVNLLCTGLMWLTYLTAGYWYVVFYGADKAIIKAGPWPFGLSFAITSLISALLVVLKETNEDTLLTWMKAATGHHWVTHGILNLVLFLFFGWLLARPNDGRGLNIKSGSLVVSIVVSLIASGMIIVGFYLH